MVYRQAIEQVNLGNKIARVGWRGYSYLEVSEGVLYICTPVLKETKVWDIHAEDFVAKDYVYWNPTCHYDVAGVTELFLPKDRLAT